MPTLSKVNHVDPDTGDVQSTTIPMRPEYPDESYGSPDVPHGTNSVVTAACKILKNSMGVAVAVPTFDADAYDALVAAKKDELTEADVVTEQNPITDEQIAQARADRRGFTVADAEKYRAADVQKYLDDEDNWVEDDEGQMVPDWSLTNYTVPTDEQVFDALVGRDNQNEPVLAFADDTDAEARAAIVDERKDVKAATIVRWRVDHSLDTPLTDDAREDFLTANNLTLETFDIE